MADEPPLKRQKSLSIALVPRIWFIRLHRRYHDWPVSLCLSGFESRQRIMVGDTECAIWYGDYKQEQDGMEEVEGIDKIIRRLGGKISADQTVALCEEFARNVKIDNRVEEID